MRLIELVVRGGWPSTTELDPKYYGEIAKTYLDIIINNDINQIDEVVRDKNKFIAPLRSLDRNEGTLVGNKVLIKDMNRYDKSSIDEKTIHHSLNILEKIFIIENQDAFDPNYRLSMRVAKTPKRHFIDPSLAVASLGWSKEMLYNDLEYFGFL